jgi:hypothetical protein
LGFGLGFLRRGRKVEEKTSDRRVEGAWRGDRGGAEIRMPHLRFGPLLGLFSVAGLLFVPSVFISFWFWMVQFCSKTHFSIWSQRFGGVEHHRSKPCNSDLVKLMEEERKGSVIQFIWIVDQLGERIHTNSIVEQNTTMLHLGFQKPLKTFQCLLFLVKLTLAADNRFFRKNELMYCSKTFFFRFF